jgi:hypothetical protein
MKKLIWSFVFAFVASLPALVAQKNSRTVVIQPFFQESFQLPVQYALALPMEVKLHEHRLQGDAGTSPQMYVITPKKGAQSMEITLYLSDPLTGFAPKSVANVAGAPVNISSATVRALIWYRNPEKKEGMQLLFLKEVTSGGKTFDLGMAVTGKKDMLEKHYVALLRAFETSMVIPVSEL